MVEKILSALEQFYRKSQKDLRKNFSFQWLNQGRNVGHRRTVRRKTVGFRSQYIKFYKERLEKFDSGVRIRYLRGRNGRKEADSNCIEQSAVSRHSCSEDFGSRSCGQVLTESSESCSSPENLTTDERTNWQISQIRSLSHQLIQSIKVTDKIIKPRVAYGIQNSGKSSERDFVLSSTDENRNGGEGLHSMVNLQYLLIKTMRLVHSS